MVTVSMVTVSMLVAHDNKELFHSDGHLCFLSYRQFLYICDIRGIFGNIFKCAHLLMCTHQVTDAWHQEARTVAYVIMT